MIKRSLLFLFVLLLASTLTAQETRVNELINQLKDKNYRVRYRAADALGKQGPAASAAVPALRKALKDPDRDVRKAATRALVKMGAAAVPALRKALKDPDEGVRKAAADALGKLGQGDALGPTASGSRT